MPDFNQWDYDPSVQMMRRIFSLMEKSQQELLRSLEISPFDPRLRRARNRAHDLFEETWSLAIQKKVVADEEGAALLYKHCLSHVLKLSGIKVPSQVLAEDDKVARFLQKELR
ncbi:MAG: hypothetical protein FJ123_06975 [Deltaproteobacteria bacterium]|nr:hypothetical protein [Deltaproteobacteria bacterium]